MKFRRISDRVPEEIAELYGEAFSETEKIPIENIERTFAEGGELLRFETDGKFIGFVFSFSDGGFRFLVYFATVPEVRSKGYGGTILTEFMKLHADENVFLVTEPLDDDAADLEIRKRRQNFYVRNGCSGSGYTVISDNYPFDVMIVCGNVDMEDAVRTVKHYEDLHNGLL